MHKVRTPLIVLALLAGAPATRAAETAPNVPVLVPITGFLAAEGSSQRNGALLALAESAPRREAAVRRDRHRNLARRRRQRTGTGAVGRRRDGRRRLDVGHPDVGHAADRPGPESAADHHVRHRRHHPQGQSLRVPLLPRRQRGQGRPGAVRDRGAPHPEARRALPDHRLRSERAHRNPRRPSPPPVSSRCTRMRSMSA